MPPAAERRPSVPENSVGLLYKVLFDPKYETGASVLNALKPRAADGEVITEPLSKYRTIDFTRDDKVRHFPDGFVAIGHLTISNAPNHIRSEGKQVKESIDVVAVVADTINMFRIEGLKTNPS